MLEEMLALLKRQETKVAQDPAKVDADQFNVELENEYARTLHIQYGLHERFVMHG